MRSHISTLNKIIIYTIQSFSKFFFLVSLSQMAYWPSSDYHGYASRWYFSNILSLYNDHAFKYIVRNEFRNPSYYFSVFKYLKVMCFWHQGCLKEYFKISFMVIWKKIKKCLYMVICRRFFTAFIHILKCMWNHNLSMIWCFLVWNANVIWNLNWLDIVGGGVISLSIWGSKLCYLVGYVSEEWYFSWFINLLILIQVFHKMC